MAVMDKIAILSTGELQEMLLMLVRHVDVDRGNLFYFAIDDLDGGIKFKVNDGTWSTAFGVYEDTEEYRPELNPTKG
jgi:hypothetical protein